MMAWLPRPFLSVALLSVWLVLNGSWAFAYWLLGAALALAIPLLVPASGASRIKHPFTVLRLIGIVIVDVIRSNLA